MRVFLKKDDSLILGGVRYQIVGVVGAGNSAIVYETSYNDELNPTEKHSALIKELYPITHSGEVYRDEAQQIRWTAAADPAMRLARERFRTGNEINLQLFRDNPVRVSANQNSYEAYGTYYSILPLQGGESLEKAIEDGKADSLRVIVRVIEEILESLDVFHGKNMLHLDISPDNIQMISSQKESLLPARALLIDYDSAWNMSMDGNGPPILSEKDGYTAPEIRNRTLSAIGPASDLFSVCAIFFRMLTGQKWKTMRREQIIRVLRNAPLLRGEPQSAIEQTLRILVKGLSLKAPARYQTIAELREDCEELIRRVDGVGVSYSALWESARKRFLRTDDPTQEAYLSQRVLADGADSRMTDEIIPYLNAKRFALLTGPGGMGKSRLLRELWREGCRRYPPNGLMCYVSLKEFQQNPKNASYIRGRMVEPLTLAPGFSREEEALRKLDEILDDETRPVFLLLDGLNEAGTRRKHLLTEIESLSEKRGTRILITDRSDEALGYALKGFHAVQLQPLTEETVRACLDAHSCPEPESPETRRLLSTPIMLELYLQMREMGRAEMRAEPEARNAEELQDAYFKRFIQNQMLLLSGDRDAQIRVRYVLEHLLPDIAREMTRRRSNLLNYSDLYAIVSGSYRNLRDEAFMKAFPQFTGATRTSFADIASEAEWFHFAVTEHLADKMGLLTRNSDGSYSLFHENFLPYLAEISRRQWKREWKQRLPVLAKRVCAGVLAFLILLGAAFPLLRGYVYTPKERQTLEGVITCIGGNVGSTDNKLSAQLEILEEASKQSVLNNEKDANRSLQDFIKMKRDNAKAQPSITLQPGVEKALLKMKPDFPIDDLRFLCGAPAEMDAAMTQFMPWLEDALCNPDTRLKKPDDRQELIGVYRAYLDGYISLVSAEVRLTLLYMPTAQIKEFMEATQNMPVLKERILNKSLSPDKENVKAAQQDVRNAKSSFEDAKSLLEKYQAKLSAVT